MSINKHYLEPRFDKISGAFLVYLSSFSKEERWLRIYVLYLDVYFLENVLLNLVLLIFTLILMGRHIRLIRLLSASMLGGVLALLPIILRLRYGIVYILLILLTGLLVITIASGIKSMSEQWTAMMYFYVMSFVWNRLFTGLERILGTKYTLCAAIVTAIMGTVSGYLYDRKRIVKKQTIYDVEVAQQGRKLTLKALLDTGNGLREPISGRPVSIMEREVYDTLCHQTIQERYRVIPYHSIGKEHGILQGTEVDELIIWRENEPYVQKKAVIALYEGKLSRNGSYQMILHTGLL